MFVPACLALFVLPVDIFFVSFRLFLSLLCLMSTLLWLLKSFLPFSLILFFCSFLLIFLFLNFIVFFFKKLTLVIQDVKWYCFSFTFIAFFLFFFFFCHGCPFLSRMLNRIHFNFNFNFFFFYCFLHPYTVYNKWCQRNLFRLNWYFCLFILCF